MYVTELITRAYYESNVVSSEFETLTSNQLSDALYWLNACLAQAQINNMLIPYETELNFNLIVGQSDYDLDLVTEIRQATFFINNVRFNMKRDTQYQFLGSMRVEDIKSLPFHYYFQRQKGGGKLMLYFTPDQTYPLNLLVKKSFDPLKLSDDISEIFDAFYIDYILHLLVIRICIQWGQQTPPAVADLIQKAERHIRELTPIRLEGAQNALFKGRTGNQDPFFYTYYHGWSPP